MLRMTNLSKVYRTHMIETHALRGFEIQVSQGEFNLDVTLPIGTPLERTRVTASTEPSLRIATVTTGWVCGCLAASRTMSMVMFIVILRAQASAYRMRSVLGSERPKRRARRAVLSE